MLKRKINKGRFQFEYKYYNGDGMLRQRMLHLRVYSESPMQVDLWLDEKDQKILKEILEEKE